MKFIIFASVLALISGNDPLKISRINRYKAEAKKAFEAGDYQKAADTYRYLVDSLQSREDEVLLNLAHSQYHLKDTANAQQGYQNLTGSEKPSIRSVAFQQLGVINNQQGKAELALQYFKNAIKANPANKDARYNYEMLKKKLDERNKKEEEKKKKDDKNKDENNPDDVSEFAKKLKAQADKLVAERKYQQAYNLMMDGLKKDKTVANYQQYINRIKDVAGINK